MPTFETPAGTIEFPDQPEFQNDAFGYGLWEGVVDPASPEGPRAIAMRVPAHSMSKVWELVQDGYSETIELLAGSANLVVHRGDSEEWTTMPLSRENPTADGVVIGFGDQFCVVTDDEEAVTLSRPSVEFEVSYEKDVTSSPDDELSRSIRARVEAAE